MREKKRREIGGAFGGLERSFWVVREEETRGRRKEGKKEEKRGEESLARDA